MNVKKNTKNNSTGVDRSGKNSDIPMTKGWAMLTYIISTNPHHQPGGVANKENNLIEVKLLIQGHQSQGYGKQPLILGSLYP